VSSTCKVIRKAILIACFVCKGCASVEHELDDLVRALERLGGKLKLA